MAFDIEKFPTSESALRMLERVTKGFYDNSYVGKWMFQVMGMEYDSARELIEDLPNQFFPETATWGLMYHEIKWGLPVHQNLSYEERRKLIYQKRDFKAPMTPYFMENYLSSVTGFKVHVADIYDSGEYDFKPSHPNVFKVTFIGDGRLDVKAALNMVKKIRQSHTTFSINEVVPVCFKSGDIEEFYLEQIKTGIFMNTFNTFSQSMNLKCSVEERNVIETTVTTRRNLWHLDGKVKLDGSRKLNAMEKEEELQ